MNSSITGIEYAAFGYLANAFWQVPLVFLASWGVARLVRSGGAKTEHRVWVAALLFEVLLPACRLNPGDVATELMNLLTGSATAGDRSVHVTVEMEGGHALDSLLRGAGTHPAMTTGVFAMFAASLLYFAMRLALGVWRTETLRGRAETIPPDGRTQDIWRRCGGTLRPGLLRKITELRVSTLVFGPATLGILRPVVLLPTGFLKGLSDEDLSAVLAHELAHVRRWDFAKSLLYEAVSLPLAWHPLAWLTRSRIAESREMVCDAMAAEAIACGNGYARSLLRLAAMLAKGTPARTLHAIGIFDANSFERRIMNLTTGRVEVRKMQRIGIAAVCAVVALGTCATALALHVEVQPPVAAKISVSEDSKAAEKPKVDQAQMKSISKTPPVYPPEAKANPIDGPVVLAVTIGKDGSVEQIHVQKSLRDEYDRSALEAVRTWRWEPYLFNGEPTEVNTLVTVNYSTQHDEQ